ncbi:MAG TPA: alpha-glucuronidase family glycosyl hydrolase, partial [bacterium]
MSLTRRNFMKSSGVGLASLLLARCRWPGGRVMPDEDGYELWLRYRRIDRPDRLAQYRHMLGSAAVPGKSRTADIIKSELKRALPALLGNTLPFTEQAPADTALLVGTEDELKASGVAVPSIPYVGLGGEGYRICTGGPGNPILIIGASAPDVLRGVFHFLRLLQTHKDIRSLDISSSPRIRHRLLVHWDNLDGTIERGYAGRSLWKWEELPNRIDPRYSDYARACASIGINGVALNNVNAQPQILSAEYLEKTAALADVFRPYGIRVYLSPAFSSPMRLGGLTTADPRDAAVVKWWKNKADEIYRLIPDFGGFQVKANSEGQSGPQDYGAGHDDGANMLADAMHPHGGNVFWRAFVYDTSIDADRAKCAYKEFVPLDGKFRPNVFVQAK